MKYTLTLIIVLYGYLVNAQDPHSFLKGKSTLGFGVGLDYGGIGARATILPVKSLGLFAGVGYNLNAVGYNLGAQYLIPARKNYFYFTGMYGYNSVLIVSGLISDKATYYGFSGGIGYQLMTHKGATHWSFELLVPVRSQNFEHDYDLLKAFGADLSTVYPVAVSLGYHIRL